MYVWGIISDKHFVTEYFCIPGLFSLLLFSYICFINKIRKQYVGILVVFSCRLFTKCMSRPNDFFTKS